MAAINAFRVTQHSQIFFTFFRNRIQCIALYQLHNSQALLNLRRGYSWGEGTPILGHVRDVRPEWVSFPGRKPAGGCKFLTKSLRMGHNFDIILPGNGWFSAKLNKTYCSLVNFYWK